ncbi:hypothetical protein BJY01DRAFT_171291 [Aspergillus pseudoustus]|uniref:Uncharacterized protein n=1 Tax=Aspergillus pseudoustus TaxID=1810923 RepID=A0ABR4KWJ9_9EURO
MVPSDEDGCDPAPKPVQAAFSISVRSSRRRRSRLSRPPTPPSACEESAHYPVFNPEDPRHNPALRTTVSPDNADGLSQTAHLTGSRHWMQSLPGRSLRRARSGLQALRSGLHRRSANQNTDSPIVINGVWPSSDSAEGSSDQHERSFSSTVSEASTEEDYDFGTHLYRTGCNYPDFSDDIGKDLGSPSETHHSHHIISPALSTGAEAPLDFVDPLEPAPEDSPGEDLSSPVTPDSDSPSFVDTHQGSQEGQNAEEPTTASVPTSPAEDAKSPVQSPSGRRSLVASASAATAPLDETRLNFPVDDIPEDSQPQVAVEETDVTFVSHISAHNALELQQTFQSPVDDVDDGKTKDTPSKDTFAPESPQVENIAEEEESLPKEGMLKSVRDATNSDGHD